MIKEGQLFEVSDELTTVLGKKAVGEAKKVLCFQEKLDQTAASDYRMTGTAIEAHGRSKKYFIKCIDIYQLKRKMQAMGQSEFMKSGWYTHVCCMEKERQLADLLRDVLVPAYLLPPQYLFDIQGEPEQKTEIKGTAYPYRGKVWKEVLRACRGTMSVQEMLLLKEKVILQFLYAVKALHQLPGNLVHRDLKPSNLTIEILGESYQDDILVSIIDWDWVNIGNDAKDPFADICGGTNGFAHPRSFVKNEDKV